MSYQIQKRYRHGTTIIEVLFSVGIAVIGILGIASLLPRAAFNARVANEASEGHAYGEQYYSDVMVRGFNQSVRWQWYNDLPAVRSYAAYSHASTPALPTGTSAGGFRVNNRHAICIDPGFYADPTTLTAIASGFFSPAQAYRPGLFPYYQDNYDPLSNPAFTPTSPSFLNSGNAAIDNRPRLLRVNLFNPIRSSVFTAKQVEQMFLSSDDLAIATDDEDDTLPATRVYDVTGGRALSTSQYSWLATLVPREYGFREKEDLSKPEKRYTLSIVVMHQRDRSFFLPTTPTDIPKGEQVLAVSSVSAFSAFRGGNGGRVIVSANEGVEDTLRIGDWLMLARHSSIEAERTVIARWYRVIGGDTDAKVKAGVWRKNVVLEGPDWVFSGVGWDQATVVSNVVTVLERVVTVE